MNEHEHCLPKNKITFKSDAITWLHPLYHVHVALFALPLLSYLSTDLFYYYLRTQDNYVRSRQCDAFVLF